MPTVHGIRRQSLLCISSLALILAFILAACSTNTGTGGNPGGSTTSNPTSTPNGSIASPTPNPGGPIAPNPTPTPGGSTASTPASGSTSIAGYGTSNGCPSDIVVSNAPAKANVTVQPSNMNTTITVHSGDIIEVRLPFGHKWSGPYTSQGVLQLQSPSGYAWKADSVCIWRFLATGPGTTQLLFHSQALCKPGQLCPAYITNIPFDIQVK